MNSAEGGKKKSGGKAGAKKAQKKEQSGVAKEAGMQLPSAGKTATTTLMQTPEHPAGKIKQAKSVGDAAKKGGKKNKLKKSV